MTWYNRAAIRGMVLNGMNDFQILEVFEFETEEECGEVLNVIDELKKELEDGKDGRIDRI